MNRKCRNSITFFLLLFLFIGITGCEKETKHPDDSPSAIEQEINVSDENEAKIPYDNQTDVASLKELEFPEDKSTLILPYKIRSMLSVTWNIEGLQSDGMAQIVRYNKGEFYSVDRIEGGKYLFLLYEESNNGYHTIDGLLVSTLADKVLLESIAKGMKREDIITIDPSACVFETQSYHRFEDNSILEINYIIENNEYIVSTFQFLENQLSVLDYLLPEDFEKIQNDE